MKILKAIRSNIIIQLTIIVFLMVLVFAVMLFQNLGYFKKVEQEGARTASNIVLTQAGHSLNSYYDSLLSIAESFGYSPAILDYLEEESAERPDDIRSIEGTFANTLLLDKHLESVLIYDSSMNCIAALGKDYRLPESRRILRPMDELIPDRYDPDSDDMCFAFYLPVYRMNSDAYMEQLGMCVFVLNRDALDDALSDALSAIGSAIELRDNNGNLLAFSTTDDLKYITDMSELDGASGFWGTHGSWMKNGWRISVAVSVEAAAGEEKSYQFVLNIIAIVFIIMMAALMLYTYVRLARPIHRIGGFLEEVITEPAIRLRMKRDDDIGTVADNLDRLLDENQRVIHEIRENKILLYEVELSRQKMKLLAYRNQINPHFLYNTFACINGMALMNDQDDIAEITMALSDIFRYAVKGGNIVSIRDEITHMERYKKIIEYRFMGKILINIHADEDVLDKPVIKLIMQPLAENAVFHGLEQKMGKGTVDVNASMSDGRIRLEIKDDGCGIDEKTLLEIKKNCEQEHPSSSEGNRVPEFMKPAGIVTGTGRDIKTDNEPENTHGVGMVNIVQRLKLFYEQNYTFTINSIKDEGTCIVITVPDRIRAELQSPLDTEKIAT